MGGHTWDGRLTKAPKGCILQEKVELEKEDQHLGGSICQLTCNS